jgi:hypothetical protein
LLHFIVAARAMPQNLLTLETRNKDANNAAKLGDPEKIFLSFIFTE